MNHRSHVEDQFAASQTQLVTVPYDQYVIFAQPVIALQHRQSLGIRDNQNAGIYVQNEGNH